MYCSGHFLKLYFKILLFFPLKHQRWPPTVKSKYEGLKPFYSNTHYHELTRHRLHSYLDTLAFKSQKFKFPSTSPRTRVSPFQAMHVMLPILPWKYFRSRIKSYSKYSQTGIKMKTLVLNWKKKLYEINKTNASQLKTERILFSVSDPHGKFWIWSNRNQLSVSCCNEMPMWQSSFIKHNTSIC